MTARRKRDKAVDKLLQQLQERANELNCLYRIEGILNDTEESLAVICERIVDAIPSGWQYPDVCVTRIEVDGEKYESAGFMRTEWDQRAPILIGEDKIGEIEVFYTEERPKWDEGPFLKEEAKLIQTIAERLGHWIMHQQMRRVVNRWEGVSKAGDLTGNAKWRIVLQMLRQTDRGLHLSIARKMLNHLCLKGIGEADALLQTLTPDRHKSEEALLGGEWNQPFRQARSDLSADISEPVFKMAAEHISDEETLSLIQKWVQEDKLSFLVQVVNRNLSLSAVADAIRRYHHLAEEEPDIHSPNKRGIEVSLIRRFLSDQLHYINVAKHFIDVGDFYHLLNRVIFSTESHGKLGGKSAGMYLASQILKKKAQSEPLLRNVRVPQTCFITSDVLLHFMHYNNFDEVVEQKYKPLNQVRFEYPHIVQTFKSAHFPADIVNGLSAALDEFGDRPLIVRSSSLLEDGTGAVFSGKYKSLFLANQGSKRERLEALMDAIAEVYASTFGPDPIEYRSERGLLDFGEEMGIMIQEVVGTRVGKYFLPTFAGVAFSKNEFRWSPRIRREDGLIRLVPGLGTRAVDRLSDDYPVLIAPGQPGLRVNTSPDEVAAYSPRKMDVINLETNSFETIEISGFLKSDGADLPGVDYMVSVYSDNHIRTSSYVALDYGSDDMITTFDGLVTRTPFVKQMKAILDTLQETLGQPVDIEFAFDGKDFYLLQCRSQSYSDTVGPAPIPKGTPREQVLFSASKYISNGRVPEISHVVYVDPRRYSEISSRAEMLDVGRAVGQLNKMLPKHRFVLMGPGRWGSRGDIKLGVSVTYSDINNTAALIEIAHQKGNYVPDLSFGTHFFQDLVEADIRYLPLYPDDDGGYLNTSFLLKADNMLSEMAPEYAALADIVRLIDIPHETQGRVLKVLMNAELDQAMGVFALPLQSTESEPIQRVEELVTSDHFWRWRLQMVERIADDIDADKLGVVNLYVFGSTKNASAGPASDIDLLVHFRGEQNQREMMEAWFQGWSLSLAETNFMQTGYKSEGLLDVHIITDEDIEKKTSWATKIGAVTDAARPLTIR